MFEPKSSRLPYISPHVHLGPRDAHARVGEHLDRYMAFGNNHPDALATLEQARHHARQLLRELDAAIDTVAEGERMGKHVVGA